MCDVCADRRMKSILGVVNVWADMQPRIVVYASTSQFALFVVRKTSLVRGIRLPGDSEDSV